MPRETFPIRSKQHASHSNTARNRNQLPGRKQQKKKEFRPQGVFPFFDLPYELRHEILKLSILEGDAVVAAAAAAATTTTRSKSYQQALSLFLTCRWLYEEAASIFYHEFVLDTRAPSSSSSCSSPSPFLVRSVTPRLSVRTLRIRFYIKEHHLGLFHGVYGPILRDMAQNGQLEHLVLEIGYPFPSPSFWGGVGGAAATTTTTTSADDDLHTNDNDAAALDPFYDDVCIIPKQRKKNKGDRGRGEQQQQKQQQKQELLYAPLFVTQAPFQGFLKMLHDSTSMMKITVYLEAAEHPPFWCAFHRAPPSGGEEACGGSWPGHHAQPLLKIRWRDLVKTFAGAQALTPPPPPSGPYVHVT